MTTKTNRHIEGKITFIIYLIMLTTFMTKCWGQFDTSPSLVKGIFSLSIYVCILSIPFIIYKYNDYNKNTKRLILVLLLMGTFQIVRSVINRDASLYAFGNKYITLFFNENCAPIFFPPIFIYLAQFSNCLVNIWRSARIYVLLSLVLFFINFSGAIGAIIFFLPLFIPYVNLRNKLFIGLAFVLTVIQIAGAENGARVYLLAGVLAFISVIIVNTFKSIIVHKIVALLLIIAPFFVFLPLMFVSRVQEDLFKDALDFVYIKTGNEELSSDTRTFLYVEITDDLIKTKSLLIGKGAFSHYYSTFFDVGYSYNKYGRLTSEVTFLNFLLRGGILYFIIYSLLFWLAIYISLSKAKSKFLRSVAIMLSSYYFIMFIGMGLGCDYTHVVTFTMIGMCLSKKCLNLTDDDIQYIMNRKTHSQKFFKKII